MNIKVFTTNNLGKIEFDRASLEKVLNEIYEEGYRAGEKHAKDNYWTWCPTITTTTTPYNTISGSTITTAATTNTTPTLKTNGTTTGSINATTNTIEKEIPTIDTSFSINGEKVDLSAFAESFKEANEAFSRAVNTISRSNRYNNPNVENILAKEIRGL